jgi:hypothetical protein
VSRIERNGTIGESETCPILAASFRGGAVEWRGHPHAALYGDGGAELDD